MDLDAAIKKEDKKVDSNSRSRNFRRLTNFDIKWPIDLIVPMKHMGNLVVLFHTIISQMEKLSLNVCIHRVTVGLDTKNWQEMSSGAHQLLGASVYVGAGRLYYLSY